MTIHDMLIFADKQLSGIDESGAIIYSLLSKTLNLSKEYLWSHPDKEVTREQFAQFSHFINRAASHEPIAYIIGEKEFYNLPFFVTQDTLIPRPESEKIIDLAIAFLNDYEISQPSKPIIVDVGTGSGCIAISLAKLIPNSTVYAVDISTKALKVARRNVVRHNAMNVTFLSGSLLDPLQEAIPNAKIDLIVANLPYISDAEFKHLPANIKLYEPEVALRSGSDPDVLNRQLIKQADLWLKPGGQLLYETTNGRIVKLDA